MCPDSSHKTTGTHSKKSSWLGAGRRLSGKEKFNVVNSAQEVSMTLEYLTCGFKWGAKLLCTEILRV